MPVNKIFYNIKYIPLFFLLFISLNSKLLSIQSDKYINNNRFTSVKNSKKQKDKVTKKNKKTPPKPAKSKKKALPAGNNKIQKKSGKIPKGTAKESTEILEERKLENGVVYKIYSFKSGKYNQIVHVIEADLNTPDIKIKPLKAENLNIGLKKIHDIVRSADSNQPFTVLGAVNANFWRKYSNYPIGPTVSDGEVIEMPTHKRWSSAFFDKEAKMYIDNFFLDGNVTDARNNNFPISLVNRRKDSTGIVMYNSFCGGTVPFIPPVIIEKAFDDAVQDSLYQDITDFVLDSAKLLQELTLSKKGQTIEHNLIKISLQYLTNPAVNKLIPCKVIDIRTGNVSIPKNGCVLSLGTDFDLSKLPKIGETINFQFSTNDYDDVEFISSVAGTPRLVKNGRADHEAYYEGSHGRRFINGRLPRTSIGTNKDNDKIFLVSMYGFTSRRRSAGATLQQTAQIMKKIGAYNAMNLDGGGSTVMLIDNKNVLYKNFPEASRRISVALAVVKTKIKFIY